MSPFDYLNNCVKTRVCISPDGLGVGMQAIVPIKKGEQIFTPWEGESRVYSLPLWMMDTLHQNIFRMVLEYFSNEFDTTYQDSMISFRLVNGANFIIAQPLCLLNTKYNDGSCDSKTGIALRDIREGEEIYGNYNISKQLI